jgi:hypothetical protein
MCEALGYDVLRLKRVRIMNVTLSGLPSGEWRFLTENEMTEINRMVKDSVGTEEASKKNPKIQKSTKKHLTNGKSHTKILKLWGFGNGASETGLRKRGFGHGASETGLLKRGFGNGASETGLFLMRKAEKNYL